MQIAHFHPELFAQTGLLEDTVFLIFVLVQASTNATLSEAAKQLKDKATTGISADADLQHKVPLGMYLWTDKTRS